MVKSAGAMSLPITRAKVRELVPAAKAAAEATDRAIERVTQQLQSRQGESLCKVVDALEKARPKARRAKPRSPRRPAASGAGPSKPRPPEDVCANPNTPRKLLACMKKCCQGFKEAADGDGPAPTRAALLKLAAAANIQGRSKMRKEQLVAALRSRAEQSL